MNHPIRYSLLILLLATCNAWAAGTPISQSRAVNADARVDVSNVKGAVTVTGWDKPEVAISGTLGEGAKGLSVEGGADHLTVKVEPPDKLGWFSWGADTRMGDTVLDIKVPRTAEMKIAVISADVTLSGVGGRLLSVDSVSGKLHLDSAAKAVEIDSVSGNIDLDGSAQQTHLGSVSGNIRAHGLGGEIRIQTVSGDIDAENSSYREVKAGTVSGNVDLRGSPDKQAQVDVQTMSGDVHLYLPADLQARLRASSFSGRIRSDFGAVKEKDHGPGSSLDAISGDGDGQVKIESFSGDIEIHKQ